MYESFFRFEARPFLPSPLADRYFAAASVEHARETVTRCLERAEGAAMILGPAGTGKSTLCQVIAQHMRAHYQVAMLASARLCTRRALLQNILFELKLPYRDREEGELRLSLIDALEPSETSPNGMVLIVDEAHMLPLRLLEEIRMITNLVRQGQPRVRLVLAAGMVLDERMASPRLESFNQRVVARCYLQSMTREETCGYIRAQIHAVGGQADGVFTPEALRAVHRATDGIPRLVNQVCDHVLLMAAIGRRAPVDALGVEEAWADLQQLPTPWTRDATPSAGASDILEFGQLDDDTCGELDDSASLTDPSVGESSRSESGAQAVARLNQIETKISALAGEGITGEESFAGDEQFAGEGGTHQFRPHLCREPEIELVFHHAHNPFSERFEQEEVIVDPLTSLETLSGGATHAGRDQDVAQPTFAPQPAEPPRTSFVEPAAARLGFDPVLPDVADETFTTPLTPTGPADDCLPGDDRDLLEIFEDKPQVSDDYARALEAHRPRRREYRQLFASLRRR
ncbi:MAG: ExeA family protein [Pirellulaceae bacterium]